MLWKKLVKNLKMILLGSGTLVLLSACAMVPIKDAEICADAGFDGAYCVHTLTSATRDISFSDWTAERFGHICVDPAVFTEWKSEIEQLCAISKRCTYEDKLALDDFISRMNQTLQRLKTDDKPSAFPLD